MFPRQEQHCFSHHIPADVITPAEDTMFEDNELENALKYLRSQNADLRKGDLILFDAKIGYRNTGVAIFDGERVVDLYSEVDEYGSLPPQLHVIEDGVSINYWGYNGDTDTTRGIAHNNIVWFNHLLVRDQCLENLQYHHIRNGLYGISTTFTYNNIVYTIIFDYTDSLFTPTNLPSKSDQAVVATIMDDDTFEITDPTYIAKILNVCRQSLQSNNMIVFETDGRTGAYEDFVDDHTLFVTMN